jgi:hypothetical protein
MNHGRSIVAAMSGIGMTALADELLHARDNFRRVCYRPVAAQCLHRSDEVQDRGREANAELPAATSRSRPRASRTTTGPISVMISRSGVWPWRATGCSSVKGLSNCDSCIDHESGKAEYHDLVMDKG